MPCFAVLCYAVLCYGAFEGARWCICGVCLCYDMCSIAPSPSPLHHLPEGLLHHNIVWQSAAVMCLEVLYVFAASTLTYILSLRTHTWTSLSALFLRLRLDHYLRGEVRIRE